MRSTQWQLGFLGTISAFAYRHKETKKNLCRSGRSQDLPDTDFQPAIWQLKCLRTVKVDTCYSDCGPGQLSRYSYGLNGQKIESRWRRDFPHLSIPALVTHPAFRTVGNGYLTGDKTPGRGVDHPPHPASRLKREQGYTSVPSWQVIR